MALSSHPDFSFFFNTGELASVTSRGIRGSSVVSKIACIAPVTKTQWVATNPGTISVVDELLGTDQWLALVGTKKLEKSADDISKEKARQSNRLALEERSKQVFIQVIGRSGGIALQWTRSRCDPYRNPDGFTKTCLAKLGTLVGMESARSLMG